MSTMAATRRTALTGLAGTLAVGLAAPAVAQVSRLTDAGRNAILGHPATPFAGAANADITVVEYLDFNCPYCRKAAVTLNELMAADPRVRVLYKDWPIFGGVSLYAARVSLAAGYQGRYLAAHNILIDSPGRLTTEGQARDRLVLAGIDLARLDKDLAVHDQAINEVLARNHLEARALNFTGTPGLLVGDLLVPGALDLAAFQKLVGVARKLANMAPAPTRS